MNESLSKFGGYRHCGSGDKKFLEVNSKIPHAHLNPLLLPISNKYGMSYSHTEISECKHGYLSCHVNKSDLVAPPGATTGKKSEKNPKKSSQSVQICCREKEKVENNGKCKVFCSTRKHKK